MEETLDPADWEHLRSLGHRMVDDMMDHLRSVATRPAWQPVPPAARERLCEPLPLCESDPHAVYECFRRDVLPYGNGNTHPRFWGWVQGTGTPLGMLADMLAAGMNPHMAGFEQSAVLVEAQVIEWLRELTGMPAGTSGLLLGGGSMANLIGLAVARHAGAGFDVRADGLREQPQLIAYGSAETHSWAHKAMELLGLGHRALRNVAVDAEFRMSLPALARAIASDRAAGRRPLAVIATCGTVNTGAVDELCAIAELCRAERLWLHVDGAFGALAAWSPRHADRVVGLGLADSVAFDLHKWMYLPFEVACVLVRNAELHRAAFALQPSYLAPVGRGVAATPLRFADLGYDLTRGFRALKVWMSLKAHGARRIGRVIGQNIDQAEYLAERVRTTGALELSAPPSLCVVCFRYRGAAARTDDELDRLNEELLLRIQERGIAVPSSTRIGGRFALRVAITNHRTRRADLDALVAAVLAIGAELERA
jgi:glutamate/tyrosine decarboxylase-like PLP-dependent enzyme